MYLISFIAHQEITRRWQAVKHLVPERDRRLHEELLRQQNNEQLRKQFALKANMVGQWIEHHLDVGATIAVQKGTLEDQLTKLRSIEKDVVAFKPNIQELDRYHQAMQEAMVFDNSHTQYTMEVNGNTGTSSSTNCPTRSPPWFDYGEANFGVTILC